MLPKKYYSILVPSTQKKGIYNIMFEQAKWISTVRDMGEVCPAFLKSFSAEGVVNAVLNVTAIGIYEASVNGKKISDYVLAPGWTVYRKRLQYQSYDITELLKNENELCIILSKGWYRGRIGWMDPSKIEKTAAVIAEMVLTYGDGTSKYIYSDETWECSESPLRFAEIYDGVVYDANKTFDCEAVKAVDFTKETLIPQEGEIIKEQEILAAKELIVTPKGERVIDFGQEITGYVTFRVNAKKGDRVVISHAEILDRDGNFYNANYRSAKSLIDYTCKDGEQSYKPTHSFFGFRYIRLDSYPNDIDINDFKAIAVYSDIKRTGEINTSNPLLNRWLENVIWSQKDNFLDVPTDCPQRDERLGWTGDAQVFVKTASYNYDVKRFFEKWLADVAADQRDNGIIPYVVPDALGDDACCTAWGDAAVICPWEIYLTYNDKELLEKQFTCMKKWVDYITSDTTTQYAWTGHGHFGDWLALDAEDGDRSGGSDKDLIASAYYANSAGIVCKVGKILGEDVSYYEELRDKIIENYKNTYNDNFKTQTEHALSIVFGLCRNPSAVADKLAAMVREKGCMVTGFVGTPCLQQALTEYGYSDIAWDLMLREEYPSWLYSVKKGATTIWEHLDGIKPDGTLWSDDMNSYNHYSYGAAMGWLYTYAAGIRRIEEYPGFSKVLFAPYPTDRLDYLNASIQTVSGLVCAGWKKNGNGFTYTVTTPVPSVVRIGGKDIEIAAGTYSFDID